MGTTHSPKLDERLDSSACLMEQEGEVSDSSSLDAQIEYSCDSARKVYCFSEQGTTEEEDHAIPESVLSAVHSRLEEVKEAVDRDAANSEMTNMSNPAIGLISDNHAVEENRDASPEGQRVSSPEVCCFHICSHSSNFDCSNMVNCEYDFIKWNDSRAN